MNNDNRRPVPLYTPKHRERCPVCGEVSYSASGIHPQCAMQQADAKRMNGVKSPSKSLKKTIRATDAKVKPWQKTCPKCQALVHIRKKLCDCGHALSGTRRSKINGSTEYA